MMSFQDAAIHEPGEIRAAAEDLAFDRISPDQVFDAGAAIDLYAEAFAKGVEYCNAMRKDGAR